VLNEIVDQATNQAGLSRAKITAAGFGLAGYDWPEDRAPHLAILHELLPSAPPFALVNDALLGLWAGTEAGWGVVVAAGTSCNCYGRNPAGQIGRTVGSSHFGEYAGAEELVWWAVQAVARAWTRRGPASRLAEALIVAAGASDVEDLLAGLMRGRYHLSAGSAPLVFALAADGDPVALDLVRRAGRELGSLAAGVSRQLDLTSQSFDVVLAGSFFNGSPLVQETMAETLQAIAPRARLVRLDAPPVVGAVLLAMEQAGVPWAAARGQLIESIRQLRL
jgi:N-acetylglucosamine kinase-like BadF-type ATPase